MATKLEIELDKRVKNLGGSGKTLRVGFLETAKYPTGESVAQVAFWNEYGTSRGSPPRPFFRSMIEKNKAKWGAVLGHFLKTSGYDAERAMNATAEIMEQQLYTSIIELTSPKLSPVTLMIRKLMQGKTDQKAGWDVVQEARRRVAAGESTAGVNDKPLIYSNVMATSIAHDIRSGSQ